MTPEERTARNVARFEQAIDRPRAGYYPEQLKTLVDRPAMEVELLQLSEIVIENRHRKDLGDLQSLADSIREVGLLHPPVVSSDNHLIAGQRRLEACKILGWQQVPVRRLDLEDLVRGEYAENAMRKDFTASEAVAIKKALEPIERKAAKERQAHGGPRSEKLSEREKGNTRDRLGRMVGMSGPTLEKAEAVVNSGDVALIEEMDRTGKVDPAYRVLRERKSRKTGKRGSETLTLRLSRSDVRWIIHVLRNTELSTTRSAVVSKLARALKATK